MQGGEVDPQTQTRGAPRAPAADEDVSLSGNQRGTYGSHPHSRLLTHVFARRIQGYFEE